MGYMDEMSIFPSAVQIQTSNILSVGAAVRDGRLVKNLIWAPSPSWI